MGSAAQFVGTPSITERLNNQNVIYKALAKRIMSQLRCGMPGTIVAFDATTQLCSVTLNVTENVINNQNVVPTPIPQLDDVLLILPGDADWCITFPALVGSECYVMFADMCISAWSTSGGLQNQEVTRRHDLSDGFAILAPRSQPNVITDYSTDSLEIRSQNNTTKISLSTDNGIALKTSGNPLAWDEMPSPSTATINATVPITLNGTVYYVMLSDTP